MIKHHEHISLLNLPLFTKISFSTPMDQALPLPADACYTYIIEADGQIFSEAKGITATSGQVILSLCGLTLGNILSHQPKGAISSVIVHFNPELLKYVFEGAPPSLWEELESPVTQYVVQTAADEFVKHYFDGVLQFFENRTALTDNILKLKLKEIILLLLRSDKAGSIRQIVKSLFSNRTFAFKELVDAHISSGATVENLAVLTNCSMSTFKRRFKEIYNTSPNRYMLHQRLERVSTLLKLSDQTISSIGYECGFSSPEHLSRAFKKKYKLTPTDYRMSFSVK